MIVLHLVRGTAPAGVVADDDWVVQLGDMRLDTPAASIPAGRIDHDQLVALIAAADKVVTW